jgi:ATP-dependent protease ClpP protease subunit
MKKFFLISLLGLFCSHALAEEASSWQVRGPCDPASGTMELKLGTEIREPLAESLNSLIQSCQGLKELKLRLDSPGGSIYEAEKIGNVLEAAKSKGVQVTTFVQNGDECDSSCVPVFAQGQKRIAAPVSAFMFHGVAVYVVTNVPDPESTALMMKLIRKAKGLNEKWFQSLIDKKVFTIPQMYWISGQELMDQKSGFVTELSDRQMILKPYDRSYHPL